MNWARLALRWILAGFFIVAGVNHFARPRSITG